MSQISLKELEITGLKNQNKNLEDIDGKRELERKKLEDKCKELVDKNNKLKKQVTRQSSLQGEKHLIWDVLIAEETKLNPYLDFILGKDSVTQDSRKNVLMVKHVLNKNPIDTTNNAIKFLNSLIEEEIKKANIQDRVLVITWVRKVVNKYHHLATVEVKIDVMHHQIKELFEL